MSDAGAIPEAVLWNEGMLLLPQHFQQADQRAEALLAYKAFAGTPYAWGLRRLEIDRSAFARGKFSVVEIEAIMPDGLPVRYPSDPDGPPLELDLAGSAQVGESGMAVHLVVAARSAFEMKTGELQRYRTIEGPKVADGLTGENAIAIQRLVPVPRLYLTEGPLRPPPARYVAVPLAVVALKSSGYETEPFEPPRLRVTRQTRLMAVAEAIAAELRAKARQWEGKLRGAALRGEAASAAEGREALRALLRGLPRLEALLRSEMAHPFDVYLALCDIVGDLAVIHNRLGLPDIMAYTHADPLPAFVGISDFVRAALGELRSLFRTVAFVQPAAGRFTLPAPAATWPGTLVIGARRRAGQDASAISAWLQSALIGAVSRIPDMRLNRVAGAARRPIDSAPELDLLPPSGVLLFCVDADPAFIVQNEAIEISRPPEDGIEAPAELMLYLPLADGSAVASPA